MTNRLFLLQPGANACRFCACCHDSAEPHNLNSAYYQLWFAQQFGRAPDWLDAMSHCSSEVRASWEESVLAAGQPIRTTGRYN